MAKRDMPGEGRDGAEDSRQGRLMRAQLPAGATVMEPGSVFTAGAPGTQDGAKAGGGGHGGSLSGFDKVMLFTAADQQRFGWLAGYSVGKNYRR